MVLRHGDNVGVPGGLFLVLRFLCAHGRSKNDPANQTEAKPS
jgi:hypothetical protein